MNARAGEVVLQDGTMCNLFERVKITTVPERTNPMELSLMTLYVLLL